MLEARCSTTGSKPWVVSFWAADPHKIPIDSNGNLTSKTEGSDTWTYSWNAENQLTKVEKNGVEVARFSYDPGGRRVEKVAGGVTSSYTYDGIDILREVRGSATLKYVHGPGIDEPLAVDDGTTLSCLHADGLGSIVKTTNAAGSVTLMLQYDAWGYLEAGPSQGGHAFTGREWDPETGFYYYRTRYYDGKLGRFSSEDPIGLAGGINLYGYVLGNPTTLVDPMGTQAAVHQPVNYTPTAGQPPDQTTQTAIQCFADCVGRPVTVTGAREQHPLPPGATSDPHSEGRACDVRPTMDRPTAERCYRQCFDTNNSYAQEECPPQHPHHYHFQTRPGLNRSHGFAQGCR